MSPTFIQRKNAPLRSSGLGSLMLALILLAHGEIGCPAQGTNTQSPSSCNYTVKVIPGKDTSTYLGTSIQVGVFGAFGTNLLTSFKSDPSTLRRNLRLALNGLAIPDMPVSFLGAETFNVSATTECEPTMVLQFVLDRNGNDETNRKAWDGFLAQLHFGVNKVQVGVAGNDGLIHVGDDNELNFAVAKNTVTASVVSGGVVLFLFAAFLALRSNVLRDSGPGTLYSLGKSQMAFWGILVALCFVGVWIISGKMEPIPSQVLTLLGISGVTGLGAMVINKTQAAATARAPAGAAPAQATKNWFEDIISDGTGPSFHRVQVVLWTLILGIVFVCSVMRSFSMPEFDSSLLILMGISNGTYLGFKQQE